jgi:hypothetical protein
MRVQGGEWTGVENKNEGRKERKGKISSAEFVVGCLFVCLLSSADIHSGDCD